MAFNTSKRESTGSKWLKLATGTISQETIFNGGKAMCNGLGKQCGSPLNSFQLKVYNGFLLRAFYPQISSKKQWRFDLALQPGMESKTCPVP